MPSARGALCHGLQGDACVFYRDLSDNTIHLVPGPVGEDCVPTTLRNGLTELDATIAAKLTRGANFSCAKYIADNPLVLVHTNGWSGGKFTHSNYTTEDSCKAACAADPTCSGLTYVTTNKISPCVLYTQVTQTQPIQLAFAMIQLATYCAFLTIFSWRRLTSSHTWRSRIATTGSSSRSVRVVQASAAFTSTVPRDTGSTVASETQRTPIRFALRRKVVVARASQVYAELSTPAQLSPPLTPRRTSAN